MRKNNYMNLRTGDIVIPRKGELKGIRLEVIDMVKHTIIASTIEEVAVERNDGVKLIFPYWYTISGLYQTFSIRD